LRIAGMSESGVDEVAAPVYSRFENPKTTILGGAGQVDPHLVARGDGERAVVSYANQAKVDALAVPSELIAAHGAVSEEVAASMAQGVLAAARASVSVAITGIAGPDGGTPDKPVGLVYVATCGAAGTRVRKNLFPGGRELVRQQSTQIALEMLRRGLVGLPPL